MSKRLKSSIRSCLIAALVMALVAFVPAVLLACPTCKDQLASDANTSGVVEGYFWSILLMLSMPIVILGSLGAYVVYQLSKSDAKLPAIPARPTTAAPASSVTDHEAVGA